MNDTTKGGKMSEAIIAYKAFNEDWTCRGHKFEVGQTYTVEGKVEMCERGFHACENPFDVLSYYPLVGSKFAVVEQSGKTVRHDDDTKIASATITIKAELPLGEFVGKAIGWLIDATKGKGDDPSGYSAQIGSSGDSAQIDASGDGAVIASAGPATTIRGAKGTWVSLAEFDDAGKCIGFATGCIGQKGLKPDVWYEAKGGKLVEAGSD